MLLAETEVVQRLSFYRGMPDDDLRRDQIVEVYFGWSIPHEAPAARFIDENQAEKQRLRRMSQAVNARLNKALT